MTKSFGGEMSFRQESEIHSMNILSPIKRLLYVFAFVLSPFSGMIIGDDSPAAGDEAAPKLEDARAAWRQIYAEYRKGVFAEMNWISVARFGKESEESLRCDVSVCGDFQWVRGSDYIPARPNGIGGWNDKYRFSLEEDQLSGPYQVKSIDEKKPLDDSGWMELFQACTVLFNGLYIRDTWIDKVVCDPSFTILTASYTNDPVSGRRLAEFTFEGDCPVAEVERAIGGRIVLIPEYFWMVRELRVDIESVDSGEVKNMIYEKKITYRMVDDIPFPEMVQSSFTLPDGTPTGFARTSWITKITRRPIPKEQCYLSYYGFDEPDSTKHLPAADIAFTIGAVLIGAGIYLKRRVSKGGAVMKQ